MRLALCALALVLLAGCGVEDGNREPYATVELIALPEPGMWLLDGRRTAEPQVEDHLAREAQSSRRELNRTSRLIVRINAAAGADYGRVQDMASRCQQLGIDLVQVGGR
jgi:hypothetical protein